MGMKGYYFSLYFVKNEGVEEGKLFESERGSLLGVEKGIFLHGKKDGQLFGVEVISLLGKKESVLHVNILGKDNGTIDGSSVSLSDGYLLGYEDDLLDGIIDGMFVGSLVGSFDGNGDGSIEGSLYRKFDGKKCRIIRWHH